MSSSAQLHLPVGVAAEPRQLQLGPGRRRVASVHPAAPRRPGDRLPKGESCCCVRVSLCCSAVMGVGLV